MPQITEAELRELVRGELAPLVDAITARLLAVLTRPIPPVTTSRIVDDASGWEWQISHIDPAAWFGGAHWKIEHVTPIPPAPAEPE